MSDPAYPIIELSNSAALRGFTYKGQKAGFLGIGEDEMKAAIKSALERIAWEVQVQWGRKTGPDIQATLGSAKMLIEVKGEGSRRQMLGNYFLQALGQILLRMSDPSVEYALAFPAHASYVELVLKIPRRVREALRLDFYFVRPSGTTYEVGLFRYLSE